ncbi:hypothetical protein FRC09_014725, partial [Ceratobasidium sp. 395]
GATRLQPPTRDNVSINPEDGTSRIGDTRREERMCAAAAQQSLRLGFVMPEDEGEVQDMAERNARIKLLLNLLR